MKSQFSEAEFKDMMFNPSRVPEGMSIFEFFPQLNKHKIFKKSAGKELVNEMVMYYVLCMYDKHTPFRTKYRDILKRKVAVANEVGFETESGGRFVKQVEDMLKGRNKTVNLKIVEYVRIHRSFKYAYLVSVENSYYQIMEDVMAGSSKRISELKNVQQELEDTMLDMLNQDDNQFVKDMVLRYMEEDRIQLRPEDIAMKLSKGEQAITADEIWQ